jgi:hypothetical protein
MASDDQRDYSEERYLANLCPLCDRSPCPDGGHCDRTFRIVDALDLTPGDLILTATGLERVTTRSEMGEYSAVVIHTDESDIGTRWPCEVKVITG